MIDRRSTAIEPQAPRPRRSLLTRLVVAFLQAVGRRVVGLSPIRLRRFLDLISRLAPPMFSIRRRRGQVGGIPVEYFTPRAWDPDTGATCLHYHGGGYVVCSSTTHAILVTDILRASEARGIAVNYRLAPEHPFPAAVDDCESAYLGLLERGVDADRIVLTGDSAGGALALAVMFRLRDAGLPLPRAVVLLSPWVDLECRGSSIGEHAAFDYLHPRAMKRIAELYLAGHDSRDELVSPIHGDLSGLPPMLIQAGGSEMLHSEIVRFADKAEAAGVDVDLQVWEGMVHVFQGFKHLFPQGKEAVAAIGGFIREQTATALPPAEGGGVGS